MDWYAVRSGSSFTITWNPISAGGETTSDEILTVLDSGGNALASSDGSSPSGSVSLSNLPSGTYTAVACGYLNTDLQPYNGTASVTTVNKVQAPPPHQDAGAGRRSAIGPVNVGQSVRWVGCSRKCIPAGRAACLARRCPCCTLVPWPPG